MGKRQELAQSISKEDLTISESAEHNLLAGKSTGDILQGLCLFSSVACSTGQPCQGRNPQTSTLLISQDWLRLIIGGNVASWIEHWLSQTPCLPYTKSQFCQCWLSTLVLGSMLSSFGCWWYHPHMPNQARA